MAVLGFLATIGGAWSFFFESPPVPAVWKALGQALRLLGPVQWIGLSVMLLGLLLLLVLLVIITSRADQWSEDGTGHRESPAAETPLSPRQGQEIAKLAARLESFQREERDREELRSTNGVRGLRELEAGLELRRLPGGVYGFIAATEFASYPSRTAWWKPDIHILYAKPTVPEKILHSCVRSKADLLFAGPMLEVHLTLTKSLLVVGFVSDEQAIELGNGSASKIWLYLSRLDSAPRIVGVPADEIQSAWIYSSDAGTDRLELILSPSEDGSQKTRD